MTKTRQIARYFIGRLDQRIDISSSLLSFFIHVQPQCSVSFYASIDRLSTVIVQRNFASGNAKRNRHIRNSSLVYNLLTVKMHRN